MSETEAQEGAVVFPRSQSKSPKGRILDNMSPEILGPFANCTAPPTFLCLARKIRLIFWAGKLYPEALLLASLISSALPSSKKEVPGVAMRIEVGSGTPSLLVLASHSLCHLQNQYGSSFLSALTEGDALVEEGVDF